MIRTLVSYLNERTPQELRTIADKWGASQVERLVSGNTFQLSQEMDSEFLQRRLVEKLSRPQLGALQFFIRQEDQIATHAQFVAASGLPASEATAVLVDLTQIGLLFTATVPDTDAEPITTSSRNRSGWNGYRAMFSETRLPEKKVLVFPHELVKRFQRLIEEKLAENKPELGLKLTQLPLRQLLSRVEPEVVESQAEAWGLIGMLGTHSAEEVADEMAKALTDEAAQNRVLSRLDEASRKLFSQLKNQHFTTISALLEEYVSLKRLGRTLRPLTESLLVWEAFENGQSLVFVPSEIKQPRISSSPVEQGLQTVTEPSQAVTPFPAYALAWDALTLLNYLGQNEIELTSQSYIPKRHIKKIVSFLWPSGDSDNSDIGELRFGFLVSLCQRLHLFVKDEDSQRIEPGLELNEWLKKDFYSQTKRFFETWLQNSQFLNTVNFPYYYASQQVILKANQTMLGWLQQCQPGVWYSFESLLTKVQREEPFFIKSRKDLLNQYGLRYVEEMARHWNQVEAEIINRTFGTVFEWFGIIRVSRNPLNRLLAFSLTDFGAELIGKTIATPLVLPTNSKPILVQPNFEIMLLAPHVETLWSLLKFCNQKKLDLVSIFTLDRTSVLRGMETGFTPTAVLEWLANHNPQPLPQNIEVSVQDWGKGFKRVTVEQTVLLETEDPTVLDELMQSKKYADYFVRRLSPTAAVLRLPITATGRTDPLKNFRTQLKNGGFFAR